jgi:uncharacterized OB-fold protein
MTNYLVIGSSDKFKYNKRKGGNGLFVFVFMHGCPFCNNMMLEWMKFQNADIVDTLTIDNISFDKIKSKEPILAHIKPSSYPHLEYLPNASSSQTKGMLYVGMRSAVAFEQFVKKYDKANNVKKNVKIKNKSV